MIPFQHALVNTTLTTILTALKPCFCKYISEQTLILHILLVISACTLSHKFKRINTSRNGLGTCDARLCVSHTLQSALERGH